ncbi:MAG: thioredoxin-disulfide reductase [Candidatus Krumholzibacteriota bacterium]|nr:thioredoxin-disulfide reductase [Candidatus Krumholzibacteriota bacterium]
MYDVTIIGSGPAGLTAAIYSTRADLKTLVIDGMAPGGQLMITTEVDNFPGFPEGIQGPELMAAMRKQAGRFGAEYKGGELSAVEGTASPFTLTIGKEKIETKTVIIATGSSARWLGLASEVKLRGKGVSACATCDGFFFTGKEIAVIGGGDTALEEATFLTRFASKVTIVHRRDELRGSKAMQKRAFDNDKIEFEWDSVVDDILDVGQDRVTGLALSNVKTGEKKVLPVEGVFLAIGHTPATKPFEGKVDLDGNGYVVVRKGTRTSVPGIFAAGDVSDPRYKQAISAAGMGCMAAIDALAFITEG